MERVTTGIEGLDQMLIGGFPRAHMTTITGPPGAGKTILGLQFTSANLALGRRCAFISASDPPDSVLENAALFGFPLQEAHRRGQLAVEKPEAGESERGLSSDYLTRLMRLIESLQAEVVVIDSLTEFADLSGSDVERRERLAHLRSILRKRGITALATAEAAPEGNRSRHPELDYVSDGWILLRRVQSNNLSETIHLMQVMKMKWTKHSREIRAYDINDRGLVVFAKYSVIL